MKSRIMGATLALGLMVGLCPGTALAAANDLAAAQSAASLTAQGVDVQLAEKARGFSAIAPQADSSAIITQAKRNLKQRGVKFDLKKNKTMTTYMGLKGAGKVKYTATLSKLKIKKAKKAGYLQASFDVELKLKSNLTKSQVKGVFKQIRKGYDSWTEISPGVNTYLLDFVTGENLDRSDNSKGVKAKHKSSHLRFTENYESNGISFNLFKSVTEHWTITYPASDKNICYGVGGLLSFAKTSADVRFEENDGYVSYLETSPFKVKANRNNLHFIRIR